jgi:hypothetical protein
MRAKKVILATLVSESAPSDLDFWASTTMLESLARVGQIVLCTDVKMKGLTAPMLEYPDPSIQNRARGF